MNGRFINELMGEVIMYGGLPATRGDVYADALGRTNSTKAAELFAFGPRTRFAPVGSVPLTIAQLEALP